MLASESGRAQVPEKIHRLKSGRQLAYFTEGRVEDPAVVFLPAAGMGPTGRWNSWTRREFRCCASPTDWCWQSFNILKCESEGACEPQSSST